MQAYQVPYVVVCECGTAMEFPDDGDQTVDLMPHTAYLVGWCDNSTCKHFAVRQVIRLTPIECIPESELQPKRTTQ